MERLFKSFGFAWKGIVAVFSTEANMKIHGVVSIFVLILGFLLNITSVEWIAVLMCIALVFSAEMFNTAFETLVDKVSPEHHPLAGKTKDLAAGAVLISAIISVVIGIIIFLPKIIRIFFS